MLGLYVCLHRERSSPNFTPTEAAFLAKLTPPLAEGLRTALLIGDARATSLQPDGPGLLLLGDDLSLAAMTPAAEGWLAEVAESDWPGTLELPGAVTRSPLVCRRWSMLVRPHRT